MEPIRRKPDRTLAHLVTLATGYVAVIGPVTTYWVPAVAPESKFAMLADFIFALYFLVPLALVPILVISGAVFAVLRRWSWLGWALVHLSAVAVGILVTGYLYDHFDRMYGPKPELTRVDDAWELANHDPHGALTI